MNSKEKHFNEKLNKDFFDRFVQFTIEFCFLNEFSIDRINFCLKSLERFFPGLYNSQLLFNHLLDYSRQLSYEYKLHDNLLVDFSEFIRTHDLTIMNQRTLPTLEDSNDIYKESTEFSSDQADYEWIDDVSFYDELEGSIVITNNDIE